MPTVTDFALDESTLDLSLPLRLIEDAAVVAQRLRIRLGRWSGRWFLDRRAGTRYREVLWREDRRPAREEVEAELRRVISATPGVRGIRRMVLDADRVRRTLTVEFSVESDFGPVSVEFSPR